MLEVSIPSLFLGGPWALGKDSRLLHTICAFHMGLLALTLVKETPPRPEWELRGLEHTWGVWALIPSATWPQASSCAQYCCLQAKVPFFLPHKKEKRRHIPGHARRTGALTLPDLSSAMGDESRPSLKGFVFSCTCSPFFPLSFFGLWECGSSEGLLSAPCLGSLLAVWTHSVCLLGRHPPLEHSHRSFSISNTVL